MEVSEVLSKAADLLEKPGAWTQGASSRNASGDPDDDNVIRRDAVCWCAYGAILKAAGETLIIGSPRAAAAAEIIDGIVVADVTQWNDDPNRTQAEVVEALRQAALRAAATQEAGRG